MKKLLVLCIIILPLFLFAQKKKSVNKCTDFKHFLRTHTQKMDEQGCFLVLLDSDMDRGESNIMTSPFETQFVEHANKCFKGMTYTQISKYLGTTSLNPHGDYIYYFKGKFDGEYYRYYTSFRISKKTITVKDVWIHGGGQTPPEMDSQ